MQKLEVKESRDNNAKGAPSHLEILQPSKVGVLKRWDDKNFTNLHSKLYNFGAGRPPTWNECIQPIFNVLNTLKYNVMRIILFKNKSRLRYKDTNIVKVS